MQPSRFAYDAPTDNVSKIIGNPNLWHYDERGRGYVEMKKSDWLVDVIEDCFDRIRAGFSKQQNKARLSVRRVDKLDKRLDPTCDAIWSSMIHIDDNMLRDLSIRRIQIVFQNILSKGFNIYRQIFCRIAFDKICCTFVGKT